MIFIDVLLLKDNELLFFDITKIPIFDIIITTTLSEWSFLSHKVSALHYILKPVNQIDLDEAVRRCLEKRTNSLLKESMIELQKNYDRISNHSIKISLFINGNYKVLDSDDITHCIADGTYTNVYLNDEAKPILVSLSLGVFEAKLPPENFIRIHRSTLIRQECITGFNDDATIVTLNETIKLDISASHKKSFLALYKK